MPQLVASQKLYELFGLTDYIKKFNKEELAKLDETLSKFILIKGIQDLPTDAKQRLAKQKFTDGKDLYLFFNKYIIGFPAKLKNYSDEFRNTIIANRT